MNQMPISTTNIALKWTGRLLIALLVCYLLWRTKEILITVLISAIIAAAMEPMVAFFCRFRVRFIHPKIQRLISAVLVFVFAVCIIAGGIVWLAAPFGHEFHRLGGYAQVVKQALNNFADDVQQAYAGLPQSVRDIIATEGGPAVTGSLAVLTGALSAHAKFWVAHLWELFLIPVLAFYFVVDSSTLKKYFVSFFPVKRRNEVMRILRDGSLMFRSYIIGQIILCIIAGAFMGLLLKYLHVKYALTLAVLAGITRAVPIVGPIFSGVAILLVILASDAVLAAKVLLIFSILHLVESKVIMPMFIGDRMRLHPAALLVSILIAYEFFGILGMFLAAPVTAMARMLILNYYIKSSQAAGPTSV